MPIIKADEVCVNRECQYNNMAFPNHCYNQKSDPFVCDMATVEKQTQSDPKRPSPFRNPNYNPVKNLCDGVISEHLQGHNIDHMKQSIYEEAMKATFGNDIMDYLRKTKRCR